MVVDFPTDAVAGARRTPGRLKTGGVPPKPPATIFPSLCPSVFWDFGSLFRTLRRHFLTRCRGSRLVRPRRCGDFGLVSRHKSLSDVSTTQLPVHTKQLPSRSEEYRKVLTVQCEFCVSRAFQRHFCQLLRQWQTISRRCGVPGAGCCGSGAQTILRHSPPPPPSAGAKSP